MLAGSGVGVGIGAADGDGLGAGRALTPDGKKAALAPRPTSKDATRKRRFKVFKFLLSEMLVW